MTDNWKKKPVVKVFDHNDDDSWLSTIDDSIGNQLNSNSNNKQQQQQKEPLASIETHLIGGLVWSYGNDRLGDLCSESHTENNPLLVGTTMTDSNEEPRRTDSAMT